MCGMDPGESIRAVVKDNLGDHVQTKGSNFREEAVNWLLLPYHLAKPPLRERTRPGEG